MPGIPSLVRRAVQALRPLTVAAASLPLAAHSAASLWSMRTKIGKSHLTLNNEDSSTAAGKPFATIEVKHSMNKKMLYLRIFCVFFEESSFEVGYFESPLC